MRSFRVETETSPIRKNCCDLKPSLHLTLKCNPDLDVDFYSLTKNNQISPQLVPDQDPFQTDNNSSRQRMTRSKTNIKLTKKYEDFIM